MTNEDMLAKLIAQAESEGADLVTLRAVVEEASGLGATRVLVRLGLDDSTAVNDLTELRQLLTPGATPRPLRATPSSPGWCAVFWHFCWSESQCAWARRRCSSELEVCRICRLFGKRDAGGDVIRPGAFARTLSEQRQPIPLFWQHSPEQRIGWVERASEDAKGLRVIATIDNPDGGAGAALKQGKANGLSFGYRARGYVRDSAGRVLSDIQLFEVSLVTYPMQHAARVHLTDEAAGQVRERKFNQRHYDENGQFARAGEGRSYGDGGAARGSVRNGNRTIGDARTVLSAPAQQAKPAKLKPAPVRMPTRKEIFASGEVGSELKFGKIPKRMHHDRLTNCTVLSRLTKMTPTSDVQRVGMASILI